MSFLPKISPALLRSAHTSKLPKRFASQVPNVKPTPQRPNPSDGNIGKYLMLSAASAAITFGAYKYFARHPNDSKSYSKTDSPGSLRQRFNFIDKVVKKCAASVVYIEIKDPRKIDPETGRAVTASNGSGFLVREDGWILTNAHVIINKPQSIVMVMMQDGSEFEATVEDADMNIDLALLKVNCDRKLPYLRLGKSSDVNTGEWVVALGSPLSLSHSVTAGVVSSVDRGAQELGLRNFSMRYLQTDAAITFGNSGGPLVNLEGEVIGINNLRVTAGIAFAIPVDYAKKFLERSHFSSYPDPTGLKRARNKFMGITTISVTPELIDELLNRNKAMPEEVKHGVLVWKVAIGTAAHKSGLVAGDIITHVNGIPVHEVTDIYAFITNSTTNLQMDVVRDGKIKIITFKPPISEMPITV